ncbi:sigma-70 family RNA polymerase sigma factor [Altererythrobacter sp. SALINAS58]|uniref:sigma-70 family RNA polymerase sigma factor n=1 Tax=Alteripontixanthobacter muriae TaxID=2705546 RepID=UPI00157525A3|nr:sigma-70 family RNA polymerase sigma factor [Alteripontixanthobacter muriae]NTZ42404.1 sigma-70 family RNA polymerase sigma factor [Alteripontixanthobacter muriae]
MSGLADQAQLKHDLSAVASGDIAGLRRLYEATARELYNICFRVVQNREAAEDVLQDVYIKVWNRAAGFDPAKGSAMAWLSMVARNSAIDWYRAQNRRTTVSDDALQFIADDGEAADDRLVREQEADRITALVDDLEDPTRSYIREAFLRGMTYSEIAEQSNVPLGTVKSRIRRGLMSMKRGLADG